MVIGGPIIWNQFVITRARRISSWEI